MSWKLGSDSNKGSTMLPRSYTALHSRHTLSVFQSVNQQVVATLLYHIIRA